MNSIIENLSNQGQGTIRLDLQFQPGIALITVDNPARHNALSGKMMVEFHHIVNTLKQHTHDIVAVIVMGSSLKSFCSGLDLSFARDYIKSPQESEGLNQLMYDSIECFTRLPLITVAIVIGGAIGGGSELLTGFDFVCMSSQSGFIHFIQTRMGISSPWGGMRRLIRLVGRKNALRWMAGGYRLEAEEAKSHGLVDMIVEKDEDCLNEVVQFINQSFIMDKRTKTKVSPNAVRGMKKIVIHHEDKAQGNWEYDSKIFASVVFSKL
ncbi:ClpP/crotonase-like domain-containing protein [Pilobolus umbonatus]|nr:ClpP/crotonase-like domain-containing protein [Pilobolus umbonatus]